MLKGERGGASVTCVVRSSNAPIVDDSAFAEPRFDGEKRLDTYVAMLHLAFAVITWESCGLLG